MTSEADESQLSLGPEDAEKTVDYENLCKFVNPIAKPLASRKLARKIYKLVKKATKEKGYVRQGLADVQRAFRKGETGLVVLAGDVNPVEIYCHIPAVCEEKEIPYVFTPSREHLGQAGGHKRPTIMVLLKRHDAYGDLYDQVAETMRHLPVPY